MWGPVAHPDQVEHSILLLLAILGVAGGGNASALELRDVGLQTANKVCRQGIQELKGHGSGHNQPKSNERVP